MTVITAEEALKSREKFTNYIEKNAEPVIEEILKDYPHRVLHIVLPQLTPSSDFLLEELAKYSSIQKTYFFWFIANEKDWILQAVNALNNGLKDNCGVFVIKAFLNGDKMDFKCLLKPQIQEKKQRVVNTNTPAKQLQLEYWQAYFDKCDELQSEMQVTPAPRHYQYIGIGKKGVQIMQTVSTVDKYVATEISINRDKSIFYKLEEHKEQIEKALGTLEWHIKDGVDSCKIRKVIYYDISNEIIRSAKAEEHIKLAENFKRVFSKYL
ncbi:MAG: DUF4268 domain-containing protein [Clostridia bacterium]|nr:DUF4268 domain-containing protein [Clostridia bacterium]